MLTLGEALIFTFVMGGVIFFCRIFPFLFFRDPAKIADKRGTSLFSLFLKFVEKTAPPAAITVLAFNALSAPIKADLHQGIPVILAGVCTVLLHLWKRNFLLSIFGGTFVYMVINSFS